MQGKTIMVDAPPGTAAAEFEALVAARTRLPLGVFALYRGGRPLRALAGRGTIELKTRGRGGGDQMTSPTTDPQDAFISMVAVTINGAPMRLRVDRWTPSGGSAQWGLLLETMSRHISREDVQKMLAAFCGGRPLSVLSTRFREASFGAARRVKREIESGLRGEPRPCFNPNEDNINYSDNDQASRNDRWLLVWQHMARQARASGGEIVQLVDESEGLSAMQTAEADFAADIGVSVARELIAVPPPGAAASAGEPGTSQAPLPLSTMLPPPASTVRTAHIERESMLTLAVGALVPDAPVLLGSAILFDAPTRLATTCAHVVLDCAGVAGALDPQAEGVAIGVGSADRDVVWRWRARVVSISYPPTLQPAWRARSEHWTVPVARGDASLDLAVLHITSLLDGQPLASALTDEAGRQIPALPLGDSDQLRAPSRLLIYGYG